MLLYFIPLLFFLIFIASYVQDRRKIINGFLFNSSLFILLITFFYQSFSENQPFLIYISLTIMIFMLIVLFFGAFILMIASFLNARIVYKKEGRNLGNLLTLFLGIGLLILILFQVFHINTTLPKEISFFTEFISLVIAYFLFLFINFLTASFIYQFYLPRKDKDFVIVLGSGLINGKIVPPLLAARIDKAIAFYYQQEKLTKPPKILLSGGRGDDEHLAEAEAMKQYALERGIPAKNLLIETNSKNTLENMLFSKKIMDKEMHEKKYKSIFSTNNFHLFRAGIDAKKVGLSSQGIGAKTAFYFLPNAILREFMGTLVMHKKAHIIFLCVLFILYSSFYFLANSSLL